MTGKSPDAFRTISEVADWLDRPAHVLRFWESKFTQVKPVKRAGGRRYYRPEDMRLLGGIKKLLHDDGMTIKGAQKVLREQGVRYVSALSQPLDEDGTLTGVAMPVQSEVANVDTAPDLPAAKAQSPGAVESAAPSGLTVTEIPPEPATDWESPPESGPEAGLETGPESLPEAAPDHTAGQASPPVATPAPSMPPTADKETTASSHMPADTDADGASDTTQPADQPPLHAAPLAPSLSTPPPPAAPESGQADTER
ncbi:MAG: MerR family transcriptional regulator, partial [Rhodobacterales bacterium]